MIVSIVKGKEINWVHLLVGVQEGYKGEKKMNEKIKCFVLHLLDESFFEVPMKLSQVMQLTKEFFPESTELEIESVIDELIAEKSFILCFTFDIDRGILLRKML